MHPCATYIYILTHMHTHTLSLSLTLSHTLSLFVILSSQIYMRPNCCSMILTLTLTLLDRLTLWNRWCMAHREYTNTEC